MFQISIFNLNVPSSNPAVCCNSFPVIIAAYCRQIVGLSPISGILSNSMPIRSVLSVDLIKKQQILRQKLEVSIYSR